MTTATGAITREEIAFECTLLERAVKQLKIASAEQLDERRPAEDAAAREWLGYLAWLHRIHSRAEHSKTGPARKKADAILLQALADEPAYVGLMRNGEMTSVAVYPKSHAALEWFESRVRTIEWLIASRSKIENRTDSDSLFLHERINLEIAYQYQLLVVAATTPGPGLPWEPDAIPETLPEWAYDLDPVATLLVRNAFLEVNAVRLQALHEILSRGGNKKAPEIGWATFFAIRAEETGVDSTTLLCDRSLASQIAAAALASDAKLSAVTDATEHSGAPH